MFIYLGHTLPSWVKTPFDQVPCVDCKWCDNLYYTCRQFDFSTGIKLLQSNPAFTLLKPNATTATPAFKRLSLKERSFTPPEKFNLQGYLREINTHNYYLIDLFFDSEATYDECSAIWFEIEHQLQPGVFKTLHDLETRELEIKTKSQLS